MGQATLANPVSKSAKGLGKSSASVSSQFPLRMAFLVGAQSALKRKVTDHCRSGRRKVVLPDWINLRAEGLIGT